MAVTTTPRIGVTQWSAGADPFSRAQMNAAFANVELYAARDEQGLEAAKPAPNVRGRWWFSTDTRKHLYRDDGAALHEVPLIAQQNDYTGISTVALAAEAATQATATNAPAGVTRPTATGHKSYFAIAKAAVRTWALGIGGTVADGSGETNPLIWGAPDSSMGIPTPLMYLGTGGNLRAVGALSYFGPYAAGTAATTRLAVGQVDANNAQVAAQGANTNIGLNIASQGTGAVDVRPGGTSVLTVGPSLITAAQKLTVTAGGLDVAGSPTGSYGAGELRFPTTTAAAAAGVTTLATGAAVMQFDHRGTTNTGSWQWNNGTNAATAVASLSSAGVFRTVGGDSRFGVGAMGGTGPFLRVGDQADTVNAYMIADGSVADVGLRYRTKGTGSHMLQTGGGSQLLYVTTTGHLLSGNGASGTPTTSLLHADYSGATVSGSDSAGRVTLTHVNSPATITPNAVLVRITFANTYSTPPTVVVNGQGGSNFSASQSGPQAHNVTTTTFDIVCSIQFTPVGLGSSIYGWIVTGN